MKIDTTNADTNSGFYIVDEAALQQTIDEIVIVACYDLGPVTITYGLRDERPCWALENMLSPNQNAVWVEEGVADDRPSH